MGLGLGYSSLISDLYVTMGKSCVLRERNAKALSVLQFPHTTVERTRSARTGCHYHPSAALTRAPTPLGETCF